METHHGVPLHLWNRTKDEIRTILVGVAERRSLVAQRTRVADHRDLAAAPAVSTSAGSNVAVAMPRSARQKAKAKRSVPARSAALASDTRPCS